MFGRLPPRAKRTSSEEKAARPWNDAVAFLARLAPSFVQAGEPVDLGSRPGAAVVLMPGYHGVVTVDVEGSVVVFAPGATAAQLVVRADCLVYMAALEQSPSVSGALVQVRSGVAVLSGLRVSATSGPCMSIGATARATVTSAMLNQSSGGALVEVEAGGRAIFSGTVLGPASSTATGAIDNAGVAAAVDVTGVVHLVPGAHVNVTLVSEV